MRRGIIQFESLTVVVQYMFNILKDVFISVNKKKKRKLKSCVYLTAGRLRTEIQQHVRKLCKTLGLVISYHVLVNPTQRGIYCTVRLTLLKLWYMHMSIHSSFYQKYDIAILVYVNVWKRGGVKFFSGFEDRNYINTLTVISTGIAKDT